MKHVILLKKHVTLAVSKCTFYTVYLQQLKQGRIC